MADAGFFDFCGIESGSRCGSFSVELINAECTQEEREEGGGLEFCAAFRDCWTGAPFAGGEERCFYVCVVC